MRRHFHSIRDFILPIIDFFYRPFRKWMPLQTFRYAAAGGGNTLLAFLVYYISYHYILEERSFSFGFYAFKAHIAALFFSWCISFPVGFFLAKYVVFNDSSLKGSVQLFRYFMICLFNLALNYILLKILVEYFRVYPVLAQIITSTVVILFSYLAQRHFSFRSQVVKD